MAVYDIDKYVYVLANTAVELYNSPSPSIRLDDSEISSETNLLPYLGEAPEKPADTSANEAIDFVGWSTSSTYSSTPASSSANLTDIVLTTLSFSDLSTSSPTSFYPVFQYVVDREFYDSVDPTTNQELENKLVRTSLTRYPEPFLSGLKLAGDIEINGLTLNRIDDNDVVWVVSDIEGWWNLPDSEIPDLPRGWGDGSYDAIGRYANRVLTLTGSFLPQKPEDAPAARNTLLNALSTLVKTEGAGYLIVREDGVIRKAAKVRLSGVPQIASVNARGRHDFSIGLRAVDPIKYEFVDGDPDGYRVATITSGTGWETTINNTGNVAVPVIIEIEGVSSVANLDNPPTITNEDSDQAMELVGGVASGHKLEIDTYNREVLDVTYSSGIVTNVENGRSKLAVLAEWIYLEPGSNRLYVTNPVTGSTWKIYYRSGWIG